MNKQVSFGWALTFALLVGTSALVQAQTQNTTARSDSASTMTTSSAPTAMKPGGSTGKDLIISAARSANHTTLFRLMRVSGLTEQASTLR